MPVPIMEILYRTGNEKNRKAYDLMLLYNDDLRKSHFLKEILHAFKYPHITHGPTEGFNNKIKVLKRISYGIRKFKRLRTRIFLITDNK